MFGEEDTMAYTTFLDSPYANLQRYGAQNRLATGLNPVYSIAPELQQYYQAEQSRAQRAIDEAERRRARKDAKRAQEAAAKQAGLANLTNIGTQLGTTYLMTKALAPTAALAPSVAGNLPSGISAMGEAGGALGGLGSYSPANYIPTIGTTGGAEAPYMMPLSEGAGAEYLNTATGEVTSGFPGGTGAGIGTAAAMYYGQKMLADMAREKGLPGGSMWDFAGTPATGMIMRAPLHYLGKYTGIKELDDLQRGIGRVERGVTDLPKKAFGGVSKAFKHVF